MTDHERIMDKVRRLLRLGESSDANEAAAAVAQAQRLMRKHRIEQSTLDLSERTEPVEGIAASGYAGHNAPGGTVDPLDATMRKRATWKGWLSNVLARANGCRTWWTGPTLHLAGRPSDIDAVRYLYAYCVREIDRLARRHAQGRGRTFANNFRLGCVDAIGRQLADQERALEHHLYEAARKRAEAERSAVALVRLDNALARVRERDESTQSFIDKALKMRKGRASQAAYDRSARDLGREAGRSINLSRGKGLGAGREQLP